MGKFNTNDSIWVAAAAMTYEKYLEGAHDLSEFVFVQADICNRAAEIIEAHVENARTSQWTCGDHPKHSYCYLRELPDSKRRLTIPGEFGGNKEEPENMDGSIPIDTAAGEVFLQDIIDFVHNEYAQLGATEMATDIDYIGVLNYIEQNQEIPYSNPEGSNISEDERVRLLEVKKKGQFAAGELKKMAEACSKKYRLDKCLPISWLDGSNTKTRRNLWAQTKYSQYVDDPISISIFVEKNGDRGARYRISLEIKNDGTDRKTMERYHSFLDLPIDPDSGLVFVSGSNEWFNPEVLDKPQEEIREQVRNREIPKVQLCKYMERSDDETNESYHSGLIEAVGQLIPYYRYVIGATDEAETEMEEYVPEMSKGMEFGLNTILYGPPGTGKTYNTVRYAVAICDGLNVEDITDYQAALDRFNELKKEGRIAFTTFHQSYGYEEFIEGIKPVMVSDSGTGDKRDVNYDIVAGVFKKFCDRARQAESDSITNIKLEENTSPYVFIIDEINRGNISKIFGELITLIEEPKRAGAEEAMTAILPYSGEPFSVPKNVYILGTMNTADRSIALMDTALRRRFDFEEKMPDTAVLRGITVSDGGESVNIAELLYTINQRIEYLYDREHTIGHAFFMKLKDNPSLDVLADIFKNNVVPLLQEYFYEDYEKIQLVLGDNSKSSPEYQFIKDETYELRNVFKGSVNVDNLDIIEKKYKVQKSAFGHIQSYKEIGDNI